MKTRPALLAGGIGSILSFLTPLLSLLLVYILPNSFLSVFGILFRWCGLQFAILFLVGFLYAAFAAEPAGAPEKASVIRGAALTAFLVGVVGAISEVIARIIPEVMVATGMISYTYVPLKNPLLVLPLTLIGFTVLAGLGAAVGAGGAAAYRAIKPARPAAQPQG